MAANRPSVDELLGVLDDWVAGLDADAPPGSYERRLARNAMALLRREWAQGAAAARAECLRLQKLLDSQAEDPGHLNSVLCQALRERRIAADDPELMAALRAVVQQRLAIDNPKFLRS